MGRGDSPHAEGPERGVGREVLEQREHPEHLVQVPHLGFTNPGRVRFLELHGPSEPPVLPASSRSCSPKLVVHSAFPAQSSPGVGLCVPVGVVRLGGPEFSVSHGAAHRPGEGSGIGPFRTSGVSSHFQ